MTWNELKKAIDDDLTALGISHDTTVWYIDISFPDKDDEFNVQIDKSHRFSLGISASN